MLPGQSADACERPVLWHLAKPLRRGVGESRKELRTACSVEIGGGRLLEVTGASQPGWLSWIRCETDGGGRPMSASGGSSLSISERF